jgi:hypothetical protein
MIAPSQGTGRTTLGNMLKVLFGRENVEKVPFARLTGGGVYNDWAVKPLIITDETMAIGSDTDYYKVYETLKEIIDTTPEEIRINPKYGKQRFQTTYSSFMLFSNHEDAMKLANNDRRIYVINNAQQPASPEYFVELNDWLDKGKWAKSIWRWLRQRQVDIGELVKPPVQTAAKAGMIAASKRPIDVAVEAALHSWPVAYIAAFQLKDLIVKFTGRLRIDDAAKLDLITQRIYKANSFEVLGKVRIDDRVVRVRSIKGITGLASMHCAGLSETELANCVTAINEALDLNDF